MSEPNISIAVKYNSDFSLDRQPHAMPWDNKNPESAAFFHWFNYAAKWLFDNTQKLKIPHGSNQIIKFEQYKYVLTATPKPNGYILIFAYTDTIFDRGVIKNRALPHLEEKLVETNNKLFVVDDNLALVGTKGQIFVNRIGLATVVGYYEEKYDPYLLVKLLVLPHKPPEWLVKQEMRYDALELAMQGLMPTVRDKFDNKEPDCKSAEYKEFAKNWTIKPIPIFANDFKAY